MINTGSFIVSRARRAVCLFSAEHHSNYQGRFVLNSYLFTTAVGRDPIWWTS
jgi:hypothetical protein